jgi:hypothetical protein
MGMLVAGGLPPAPGADPGSLEHASPELALAAAAPGHAVKLLDPLAWPIPPTEALAGEWRLIWLDRNPRWQAESTRKFIRWAAGVRRTVRQTRKIQDSLERDRDRMVALLAGHPRLVLAFEDVITDPAAAADRLAGFLPEHQLDTAAMAAVVEPRTTRVRPDMATEERLTPALS